MVRVTIVTTKSCVYCPTAKRLWTDIKKDHKFDYEEVDALSEKGQDIVARHGIMSVPTTLIDGRVVFTGIPDKNKAIAAVSK